MATARGKAELSDIAADHAREDYEIAKLTAKQFAPDFIQPGVFWTFFYTTMTLLFLQVCCKSINQTCLSGSVNV